MTRRILAVDDEERWLNNFRRWITDEIAVQDSALTTHQATELLRRFHYDVVLLDLAMDIHNPRNRDNAAIEAYLAARPEGTRYIVVSEAATREDTRESALRNQAFDVIFKTEVDRQLLRSKVRRALDETSSSLNLVLADARQDLLGEPLQQDRLLLVLKPQNGSIGLFDLFDTTFRNLVPVARHRVRNSLVVHGDAVVGLVWSRRLGRAVSVLFGREGMDEARAREILTEWLGYPERERELEPAVLRKVQVFCFAEPTDALDDFELPVIAPPRHAQHRYSPGGLAGS